MATSGLALLIFVLLHLVSGQRSFLPFSARDLNVYRVSTEASTTLPDSGGIDEADKNVQLMCSNRSDEYFRNPISLDRRCDEVFRCERISGRVGFRLIRVQCPAGLLFDVERQTCDWRGRITNCDLTSRPVKALPNFATESPVCPAGQLQCGDGTCLDQSVFCDDIPDCPDSSDENACTLDTDPNAAAPCDRTECRLPDCLCYHRMSPNATPFDNNEDGEKLSVEQMPQMVMISFNGAVHGDNWKVYSRLLDDQLLNANNCTVKATFFVSHKFTNYSAVQELYGRGHEIASFSISSANELDYWSQAPLSRWLDEMDGARQIASTFGQIRPDRIVGLRAPFLQTGGNTQFQMMSESDFLYDSSITVPLLQGPLWPYSLKFRMPHKCPGNGARCPTRSLPAVWEMPLNELDRRENVKLDEALTGCALVSSCGNLYSPRHFRRFLENNLKRHYTSNRAPLSISFDASWLQQRPKFADVLREWLDSVLKTQPDVYFVTHSQVLQWMRQPTPSSQLINFAPWKQPDSCRPATSHPVCQQLNPCPLTTRLLPGEKIHLNTCRSCPAFYPWLGDYLGQGLDDAFY